MSRTELLTFKASGMVGVKSTRLGVGTSVRILVSSGRDFNLGRSINTFDQLIRKRNKLKYSDYDGIIFKE